MKSKSQPVVFITGIIVILVGLALAGGGAWLAALHGSLYYVVAGLGLVITGALLLAAMPAALWVFALVLIGTLIWAIAEIGFDWWPLAARGDILFPLALWLLTPWVAGNLSARRAFTLPLWGAVVASVAVLAAGLLSNYHETDGAFAANDAKAAPQDTEGQPDEDWRAYGRTQFGQRYSPLREITPANAAKLQVAWTFRTGDLTDATIRSNRPSRSRRSRCAIRSISVRSINGCSRSTQEAGRCAGPTTRRSRTTRPSSI